RHMILMSDGDTNGGAEDHADVITDLARDDVTVTTIRIGSDAENLGLLERISRATGGGVHHVEDVGALPQLMISGTQHVMDEAANPHEGGARLAGPRPIPARVEGGGPPHRSAWARAGAPPGPAARPSADPGPRRAPLLATWQYGLGRVAVLPMDFQSGAAAWPTWRGFAKLWSQLVLWAAPAGLASEPWLEARPVDSGTLITVETRSDEPPSLLRLGDGSEAALRPIGPGRFPTLVAPLAAGVPPVPLASGG